ncbi:MAG: hypothetical protein WB676_22650 [Bryobacteraceae bacterium]
MENISQPEPVVPEEPGLQSQPPPRWNLAQRLFFRFVCCYFVLYSAPEPGRISLVTSIPGLQFLAEPYIYLWHALTPWVAIHVFRLSGSVTTYFPTGSGDTTLDYIENLLYLVFALAAALVWSIVDHKRPNCCELHSWLRVLIRYTLAFTLFAYGFAKVFPLQFPYPVFFKLTETYGDFSPMGALWSFMGASPAYVIFSGSAEVVSGLLLLTRRTTTFGAMAAAAVLTNIVALNFCYDVPVKLYSINLLFMAVILLAPNLRRLANFLVLNRPAAPADLSRPAFHPRAARIAVVSVQVLAIGYYLFSQVQGSFAAYAQSHLHPQRPPIYGLYDVETFSLNNQVRPPLATDKTRWNKVMIESPTFFQVRVMDNSLQGWTARYDTTANRVALSRSNDLSQQGFLIYSRSDAEHIVLEGNLGPDRLSVRLRRFDLSNYLLVSRGFHWINEFPFNR